METPSCCGTMMKAIRRSDHPHVYDDWYDLQTLAFVCGNCGAIRGPFDAAAREKEEIREGEE